MAGDIKFTLRNIFVLVVVLLLSGFRWSLMFGELSWEVVNTAIDEDYPGVPHITPGELENLLQQKNSFHLVDVRESDEYRVSHLNGSVLAADVILENLPKETLIVAYCSVGLRSAKYVQQLKSSGFTNVYNLRGSVFSWANNGLPLVAGGKAALHVHPYSERWGKLLKKELHSYRPIK